MPAPSLRPVSRFLARLPSLPVAALHNPVGDERLDEALAVAGRGSHEAGARDRHRARMAFRPTPSGLFAGVAIGELGAKTEVASEGPRVAHLAVSWARCAALARALLDEPEVRERTRLRAAPSLLRDGERAIWLARGRGSPAARVERAAIDPLLDRVLVATQQWARWPSVRSAAAIDDLDEGSVDELLLVLLDDGLLVDDLTPPLVGAPPLRASIERLRRRRGAREREVAEALAAIAETLEGRGSPVIPRIREARARLDLLPGSGATDGEPLAATLELRPRRMTLARAAVERAAAVAPTLLRLCHAFAPVLERATGPRLDEVLHALLARHEPGRYDLAPLALGRFGVAPGEPPPSALGAELPSLPPPAGEPPAALPPSLLRLLVARLAEGADEIALPLDELDAALPDGPPPPPTLELVLMPCRERAGEPPGAGWLLGLHGPAGATWGRFAHALGAPLAAAFDELRALEAASLDGALLADVDYAPSPSVADVATHPPLRQRTLALSSWPERGALAPADLALSVGAALEVASVADAPGALALATRDGAPVVPLPASRLRSTTIPDDGPYRLLAGWSLVRAVAPWALDLGPLRALPRLPRISVEGFIVAPASWSIPPSLIEACRGRDREAARRTLDGWRALGRLPALVQIGFEDRLLPVALDEDSALDELARLPEPPPRAYEVWPPLDRLVDGDGRRLEAVVALASSERAEPAIAVEERVDPAPDPAWRTFRLFGARDRADRLLVGHVAPAVEEARARGAITRWYFLRYVDEAGRDHLRLRVRATDGSEPGRALAELGRRLAARLAPARETGDLVALEAADHHPERARWGGPRALPLVEETFESDSALALELLALDPSLRPAAPELLVRSADALAAGLGLDLDGRRTLASTVRAAHAHRIGGPPDPLAPLYRELQPSLIGALERDRRRRAPDEPDPADAPLRAHEARLRAIRVRLARALGPRAARTLVERIAPSLVHLAAVRLVGPDPDREAIAAYLWQRALEGVAARRRTR